MDMAILNIVVFVPKYGDKNNLVAFGDIPAFGGDITLCTSLEKRYKQ